MTFALILFLLLAFLIVLIVRFSDSKPLHPNDRVIAAIFISVLLSVCFILGTYHGKAKNTINVSITCKELTPTPSPSK